LMMSSYNSTGSIDDRDDDGHVFDRLFRGGILGRHWSSSSPSASLITDGQARQGKFFILYFYAHADYLQPSPLILSYYTPCLHDHRSFYPYFYSFFLQTDTLSSWQWMLVSTRTLRNSTYLPIHPPIFVVNLFSSIVGS
jgi:hypothetical protein